MKLCNSTFVNSEQRMAINIFKILFKKYYAIQLNVLNCILDMFQ